MKTYAFPLQLAKEALLLGRFTDAISLLRSLSDSANADAQFLRAYLHFWDDSLGHSEAIALINTLAEREYAEAHYILAVCPDLSPGYVFNLPKTAPLQAHLQLAAEFGSDNASTDLAQCYLEGNGVVQNLEHARELLQQVYDRRRLHRYFSLPKNCFLLAKMLLEGLGGEQNVEEGMRALGHCYFGYGDPIADEAISLYIEIIEHGRYGVDASQAYRLDDLRNQREKIRAKYAPNWQRYLARYCRNTLSYDLRGVSFDNFMSFIFDHFEPLSKDRDGFRWNSEAEVLYNPPQLLGYITQLFREPAFLLERFTRDEIERGLGMEGLRGFVNWSVGCLTQNAETTLDDAEACIRAAYDLFAKLFAKVSFDSLPYMWWDIGYGMCGRHPQSPRKTQEGAGHRLFQANFETMVQVLQIDSPRCQSAAIHGLGHSKHPDKERVLLQFLETHPDLSERDRSYVMAAIKGEIL